MTISGPRHRQRRLAFWPAACLLLAACGTGPADFVANLPSQAITEPRAQVRTPEERAALEAELDSVGSRQAAAGRNAGSANALALEIIRQQQAEEARALLDAAEASPPVEPAPCVTADGKPCAPPAQ